MTQETSEAFQDGYHQKKAPKKKILAGCGFLMPRETPTTIHIGMTLKEKGAESWMIRWCQWPRTQKELMGSKETLVF